MPIAEHNTGQEYEYEQEYEQERTGLEVAVIGMAGRFPGASDIRTFWRNLKNGEESITFFSDEQLLEAGVSPGTLENPNYVKAKGAVDELEYFDAEFFNYTLPEADIMDPQLRLLHQCAWNAIEDEDHEGGCTEAVDHPRLAVEKWRP